MTSNNQHDLLQRIDSICKQFETVWQSGQTPRLDQFVVSFTGEEQQVLLSYLLEIDRDYRSANELPANLEYHEDSLPKLASQIQVCFEKAIDSTV